MMLANSAKMLARKVSNSLDGNNNGNDNGNDQETDDSRDRPVVFIAFITGCGDLLPRASVCQSTAEPSTGS